MYDAIKYALGVALDQRKDKLFHPVYYTSKTLNVAQKNYIVMEQELLIIIYTFKQF